MSKFCILALIGLPAVGKTSFCDWMLSLPLTKCTFNILHLCFDDFIKVPNNSEAFTHYKKQRLHIIEILKSILLSLESGNPLPNEIKEKLSMVISTEKKPFLILCDDNNYYRSMRYKLFQFCRSNHYSYAQIYFDSDLATSLQQNAKRVQEQRIPDHIITQMSRRIESPFTTKDNSQVQFSWEKATFHFNRVDKNFLNQEKAILSFIEQSFSDVSKSIIMNTEKSFNKPSSLHNLDLRLRRQINELLSSITNTVEKQIIAKQLNTKRKNILQSITNNDQIVLEQDLERFVSLLY